MERLRAFLRDGTGAVAVELAIVLPVFLLMLLGIVEFGRMIWVQNTLHFAVEEATRFAVVNSGASSAAVQAYALGRLPGLDPATITMAVTFSANDVTITANHTFAFAAQGLLPFGPVDLQAVSQFPLN